jgi:hypothetical protein
MAWPCYAYERPRASRKTVRPAEKTVLSSFPGALYARGEPSLWLPFGTAHVANFCIAVVDQADLMTDVTEPEHGVCDSEDTVPVASSTPQPQPIRLNAALALMGTLVRPGFAA